MFAVQGLIGQETKAERGRAGAAGGRTRDRGVNGEKMPLAPVARHPGERARPGQRAATRTSYRARLELAAAELMPLQLENHERAAAITRELGWNSMLELCEELSGIDRRTWERQTEALLATTEADFYEPALEPELQRHLGILGLVREMRSSDIPAFFRAPSLDAVFPPFPAPAIAALRQTLAGLGIDLDSQAKRVVDAELLARRRRRARSARRWSGAGPDLSDDSPQGRPRRHRDAAARGRPHRALRTRRSLGSCSSGAS